MVPKTLLSILGFVMAVLLVLSMISFFGGLTTVHVSGSGGEADLSGIHFEQVAATTDGWQHYPDQLLEPDELAGAVKGDSQKLTSYGTYALRILVRDEETFVLSFTSVEYSTKVFIGGDFVEEIGKITTSAEGFEPVRRPCYYVVEPKTGKSSWCCSTQISIRDTENRRNCLWDTRTTCSAGRFIMIIPGLRFWPFTSWRFFCLSACLFLRQTQRRTCILR